MACVLIQNIITDIAGFRIFSKEPLQESDIADLRHLGGLNMAKSLIVQKVDRVDLAKEPLPEISTKAAIEQLVGGRVECASDYLNNVVGQLAADETSFLDDLFQFGNRIGVVHPMVGAIHYAYQDHRPITFSPDMFWLLITQGLAQHINHNPDDFRDQFRATKEKQEIRVRHDGLHKGSLENPWHEVLDDFCRQIAMHIGQSNYTQIVTDFSTTGRVERTANAIVLMDCVKNYFNFTLMTRCGIPQVALEGTVADWELLLSKTKSLGKLYGLDWWTKRILPILDRIARNAAGKDDTQLWQNIYKVIDGSGGPYMSGWISDFFPYVGYEEDKYRNPSLERERKFTLGSSSPDEDEMTSDPSSHCITSRMLPSPLSQVPFKWEYHSTEYEMELLAGFVGFTQEHATLQIRPKIGWAVRDVTQRSA